MPTKDHDDQDCPSPPYYLGLAKLLGVVRRYHFLIIVNHYPHGGARTNFEDDWKFIDGVLDELEEAEFASIVAGVDPFLQTWSEVVSLGWKIGIWGIVGSRYFDLSIACNFV